MSVHRLSNPIQTYDWGSSTAIPDLLGIPNPAGEPQAELWMGAHPSAPSRVDDQPLDALIAEDPQRTLGRDGQLPFLFKVLAASRPLSIQAHPSLKQAVAGFARENAAGIPIDAPHRNYRDANHKPEILCALTPFEALCGFRSPAEIVAAFSELAIPELAAALQRFRANPGDFCRFLESVLQLSGDTGHLCVHMLNRLHLQPGQAIYLPARTLHAYVKGTGIELMANSNNVLRGGRTRKHVDIPELLRVLDFTPSAPTVLCGVRNGLETQYPCPASEFALSRIDLADDHYVAPDLHGPEILLCTSGDLGLISRGESVFIEACAGPYELSGTGTAFRASLPK
ncbi:MAG: mannose-6-phosphate isomerase [Rhodothermales bacterium]|jgi:mannose-6-phosphate isomerase